MLNEKETWYYLSTLSGIGYAKTGMLFERLENITDICRLSECSLAEIIGKEPAAELVFGLREYDIKKSYENLKKKNISFTIFTDEEYPDRLHIIPEAPYYFYSLGKLPDPEAPAISIVGSRGCSEYGRQYAHTFAKELAHEGVIVVSGLADGIDSESHKGALSVGGFTVGVIGCGIGDVYPRNNWQLFDALEDRGCIISEYPPGKPALKSNFPFRNRIISGLSDAVLVIEARKHSGTLHTVDHALSQGKEIYALPGRLNDPMSEGCNSLISQGSRLALTPSDILFEVWGIATKQLTEGESFLRKREHFYKKHRNELSRKEWIVYGAIDSDPRCIDEIIQKTALSITDVSGAIFNLCEKQYIIDLGGYFVMNLFPPSPSLASQGREYMSETGS